MGFLSIFLSHVFLSAGVRADLLAGGDEVSGRRQAAGYAEYAEGRTGGIVRQGSCSGLG